MYTDENYFWGLIAYYLGVLLVCVPTWRLTRVLPGFPLRALVRCATVALLGTPMLAYPDMDYLAPAWGVMLFDAISPTQGDGLLRGFLPLLVVFGLLYVVTVLVWLARRPRQSRSSAAQTLRRDPSFGGGDHRGHSARRD